MQSPLKRGCPQFFRILRARRASPMQALASPMSNSKASCSITMKKASGIRQQAQTGFAAAAAYDAYRPSYPAEAVQQLLEACEVADVERAKIADLAAGTGKFTELLVARPEKYAILAIEPHDGMRAELEKKELRGVTVVKGTAENMPEVPDEDLAAVIASQSFHWFANSEALGEIARVLQPGGVLGMIWNIEDYNSPKSWDIHAGWESAMRELVWSFDDDQPRFRHEKWKHVFDDQSKGNPLTLHTATPLFGLPIGEASVPFETWLSKDDAWKRFRTLSQIAILQGAELEKAQRQFYDAVDDPDTARDEHGRVAIHGKTFFAWTSRIAGETPRSGG